MRIAIGLFFISLGAVIAMRGAETFQSTGNNWELGGQIFGAFFIPLVLCVVGMKRLNSPPIPAPAT
jgi:hypothetical protein